MVFGGRLQAGVALATAFAVICAPLAAVAGPGQPGGGRSPLGSGGGSFVRVGPGALRGVDPPPAGSSHEPSSLRDALFGSRSGAPSPMGPPTGRYEVDSGPGFVFDRAAADLALVRFEGSPEIWALTPAPGPRGDVIFRNDVGEAILRATRIGGLTLFTPDRPEGAAAAAAGAAPPLRPPASIGPQALIQALAQASARASRVAQHLVVFEAPDVKAETDWVFADAAWVASEAFVRAAQSPTRVGVGVAGRVGRFLKVNLASGRAPDVAVRGPVLRITVNPDRGAAGRPSSERILLVIAGR